MVPLLGHEAVTNADFVAEADLKGAVGVPVGEKCGTLSVDDDDHLGVPKKEFFSRNINILVTKTQLQLDTMLVTETSAAYTFALWQTTWHVEVECSQRKHRTS